MSDPAEVVGYDPDPLHAVAYVSTPTVTFSDRDLSDLLLEARQRNAADHLTGKLVVLEEDGRVVRFAQWIEGPQAELEACVRRIVGDDRHEGVEIRRRGSVERRRFPDWDMAFQEAPPGVFEAEAAALTGW